LKSKRLVAEQRERHGKAANELAIVLARLRAETEHFDALGAKLQILIAEAFRLGGRAMRAGNLVSAGRIRHA